MRRFFTSQQFFMIYSGVLTVVFAVTVLTGFRPAAAPQKFEQINVERINLVEPDGTLRLVISNKALAPGIIIKGKEHPHPDRKSAGMIFFNDEGTENGGLIFGVKTSPRSARSTRSTARAVSASRAPSLRYAARTVSTACGGSTLASSVLAVRYPSRAPSTHAFE